MMMKTVTIVTSVMLLLMLVLRSAMLATSPVT